jgi:hypothetical protein
VGIAEVLDSFDNSMRLAIDSEGPEDIVLPAALLSITVNDPTCTSASEVFRKLVPVSCSSSYAGRIAETDSLDKSTSSPRLLSLINIEDVQSNNVPG